MTRVNRIASRSDDSFRRGVEWKQLGLLFAFLFSFSLTLLISTKASAISPIGPGNFSGSESLIDFGANQTFDPVNGDTIGGVTFGFTVAGLPSNDAVIDSGPGNTNNIIVANIEGNADGVLSMIFPVPQIRMGYGWAVSGGPGVSTVELFDAGDVSLGSLSFPGAPDPNFSGGFVGVQSDVPFVRAEVTSSPSGRFAFDNLRFEPIPEPSTLACSAFGAIGLCYVARRGRK